VNVRQFALSRRQLLHLGGVAAVVAALPTGIGITYAAALPTNADRAVAAYNALLQYLDASTGLYREVERQSVDPASVTAATTALADDADQSVTAHRRAQRYLDATVGAGLYRGSPATLTPTCGLSHRR